jgi:hypothetical protein
MSERVGTAEVTDSSTEDIGAPGAEAALSAIFTD